MRIVADILVGLVALLHFYFMTLEMFFWTKPLGLKAFGQSREKAEASKVLAANQGLYNGFLVAGLVWGVIDPNPFQGHAVRIFFLACVVIAGVYGAWTVNRKIFFIQALPALLALICVLLTSPPL